MLGARIYILQPQIRNLIVYPLALYNVYQFEDKSW